MTDFSDIIARLEKTTGPDEHLDVDIQLLANPTQWKYCNELRQEMLARAKANGLKDREEACWRAAFGGLDRYTASIDAALMLVPADWEWELSWLSGRGCAKVGDPMMFPDQYAATPAIALCIAALKARAMVKAP